MSANDRVNLVDEIAKTVQEILDEAKNAIDIVDEKTNNLMKLGQEINKLTNDMLRNIGNIEHRFEEFYDRERMVVNKELQDQFKGKEI